MAMNKRKTVTAVAAGATALALLLGGTFAWVSISQQAKNEAAGIVNVGGRLHDDFNGTNKDVYVENFTDPYNGGQPIYARIKLTEYMEVGKEAGKLNADGTAYDPDRIAASVIEGATIDNPDSWSIHKPASDCAVCVENGEPCVFHSHWKWDMGGKTTFMPTFNKDKDSLDADINGTYHGTDLADKIYYDDYVEYTTDETDTEKVYSKDGTAYYDNDPDMDKNEVEGQYTTKEETHYAKETVDGSVITMQEWKEKGSNPGNYWVYDTDGWAYWANPIMPGEATGLLLDGIDMYQNPGEKCYYAINVVGQFATVGDWTQFGVDEEDEDYPSTDAIDLLTKASQNIPTVTVTNVSGKTLVMRSEEVTFSATTAVGAVSTLADNDEYEWTVLDENRNPVTTSKVEFNDDGTATLTVGSAEMNAGLYVAARSKNTGAVGLSAVAVQLYTVTITEENSAIAANAGKTLQFSASVVDDSTGEAELSGVEWSVEGGSGTTGIDASGLLTVDAAEKDGAVLTVKATSKNGGFTETYTVTVANKYAVSVSAESDYIDRGGTLLFTAVVTQNGETVTPDVTWKVEGGSGTTNISDSGLLTVDANETASAVLTITATSKTDNTAKDTVTVTVNQYAVTISQADNATEINVGSTLQFNVSVTKNGYSDTSGVNWAVTGGSGTTSINQSGLLTVDANENGAAELTITATSKADGKISDTYTINVNKYVVTLSAEDSATTVYASETLQFTATVTKNGVTDNSGVNWSVNSTAGSTISTNGLLTVHYSEADGTVLTVTATSKANGKVTATYPVTVAADYEIRITPSSDTVNPGGTLTFTASLYENGTLMESNPSVTWKVTDASGNTVNNATIDANGKLTVNATTYDSPSLKISAEHSRTKTTGSSTVTVNYTLTLESTGTFGLDGLRVNVVESYYSKSDISASTNSNLYNRSIHEDSNGVYIMVTHNIEYYTLSDHGTKQLSVSASGGKTATLSFACNSHTATHSVRIDGKYTVDFDKLIENDGLPVALYDGTNLIDNRYVRWYADVDAYDALTYVDESYKLHLNENEDNYWVDITYITENAWGTVRAYIDYEKIDVVVRLYYDNAFSTIRETISDGYNGSSDTFGNSWATQFRLYDTSGNWLKGDIYVMYAYGEDITGGGQNCSNGFDATNGHWWAWVGNGNTMPVTFIFYYEGTAFEATIW